MAKEGEKKDHVIHERKLKYYKKTIQLLTLALEVFFLFFVGAIIFLFVASDESSTLDFQNNNLVLENQRLHTQVSSLEDQLIASSQITSTSYIQENIFISSFKLSNNIDVTIQVPVSTVLSQIQEGYERRELIDDVIVPLHSRYAQTAYDFALYSSDDIDDVNELKDYYSDELEQVRSRSPQYIVLPLGATTKTVMDFRDFVKVEGVQDEMNALYAARTSDEAFIETTWLMVSAFTSYSKEIEETPRYPLETLLLGGGDCEDSAILFASLLKASGVDWKISFVYTDLNNPAQPVNFNHVLVHVNTGNEEFFVETTSRTKMNPYGVVDGAFLFIS